MKLCRCVRYLLLIMVLAPVPLRAAQGKVDFDAETTKAILEATGGRILSGERGGVLILISRLGDGERSQRLAQKRLDDLRGYVLDHPFNGASFPPDRIVCAVGEPVRGQGCVEVYVGGGLAYSIQFRKGRRADWSLG
jgi:hypothetical protein